MQTAEKIAIAACAYQYVRDGQRIFLASGTTVHAFAKTLSPFQSLNIVTDAVNIAYELSGASNLHLVALGGDIRPNSLTMTGKLAEDNLLNFQLDSAFIGVNAIDPDGNVYLSNTTEASIVQLLLKRVPEIFILADGSKIGKTDFFHVAKLCSGHTLITTDDIPEALVQRFQKNGVKVMLAHI